METFFVASNKNGVSAQDDDGSICLWRTSAEAQSFIDNIPKRLRERYGWFVNQAKVQA